ncbi:hypothetical protein ACN27F_23205 [Solwaraspora sp. WMMB335]|uniref:hypothetical protein n=1 Tax=Solwaraspora sp. WMMB335 TaxID=3404118 RepID=UPI003B9301A6
MRGFTALLGISLILIAGCARTDGSGAGSPGRSDEERQEAFQQRADEVAAAWRTAAAGQQQWQTGYAPLQNATVLPADPEFTPETEQAFHAGWYLTEVTLPQQSPGDGTIAFPDGTLTVPLVSAAEAYDALRQGDPPQCPSTGQPSGRPGPEPAPSDLPGSGSTGSGSTGSGSTGSDPAGTDPSGTAGDTPDGSVSSGENASCQVLTVTGATLGSVDVLTSRGTAQVPAWLFQVAELAAPVAQVAVVESEQAPVPSPQVPQPDGLDDFVAAQDITGVADTELGIRLGVGACDDEITPLVQEYADAVVVTGTVIRTADVCTDQLLLHPVTVPLGEPLAARTVLDALTGRPLRLVAAAAG